MHLTPDKVRRDHDGGTAARRDGVSVFKQFSRVTIGSVKAALSRPAHQPSLPLPGRSAGVLRDTPKGYNEHR